MVFVDDPEAPVLDVADLRHLLDVLRLRPGELVVASDGTGRWVPCRVAGSAPAKGDRKSPSPSPPRRVTALSGSPRS